MADEKWLQREIDEIRLECQLSQARDCIARVPIDLDGAAAVWQAALDSASDSAKLNEIARTIGETAVGRATWLEKREVGSNDPRPWSERLDDAISIAELAWQLSGHESLQGPLSGFIQAKAVHVANSGDMKAGALLLVHALSIKPNNKRVAENLRNATMNAAAETSKTDPASAREFVSQILGELREIDPDHSEEIVQNCLQEISFQALRVFLEAWSQLRLRETGDEES